MYYNIQDISISDLEKYDWLSVEAINACKKNQITGLRDIFLFYHKNGTFKKLERCNQTTRKELSGVCKKYNDKTINEVIEIIVEREALKNMIKQMSKEDIEKVDNFISDIVFKLSVRTKNGLLGIFKGVPNTIEFIDRVFSSGFSFNSIRNIGEKSIVELDDLVKSVVNYLKNFKSNYSFVISLEEKTLEKVISIEEGIKNVNNEFSPFKKSALSRHIEYLVSNLSVRAKNGIYQLFGESLQTKEIIETIFSNSFNFQDIRNIGDKTVTELNNFKDDVYRFIHILKFINDEKLSREYAKLILKTSFNTLAVNLEDDIDLIFDSSGKIKIFQLINYLIENGEIFNQKERELFGYLYVEGNVKTLRDIATDLQFSNERIRQVRTILEDNLTDYFRFVLSFNISELVNYNISDNVTYLIVNSDFVSKINYSENVKFNYLFYSKIFGLVLENSHSVLGYNENNAIKGINSKIFYFKNCYLIDNSLFKSFNFSSFCNDINEKLNARIPETYDLYFEGYLLQFMNNDLINDISPLRDLCEVIIYNEFELVVNGNGYIVFERNVKASLSQFIVDLLDELNRMTKIEEISNLLKEKHPELEVSEQAVRSTLQRNKKQFIFIGRSSTYGLRKWEEENSNIKGGTIRDIAADFLEQHDEPQHIYDIVKYVIKFRDTSSTNILTNMQAEKNNRFVFFKGGYVGLKSIDYSTSVTSFKRVLGTNFRIEVLKRFSGWEFDKLIEYYIRTYKYTRPQVVNLIEAKIHSGEIILNKDKTITI